MAVNDVYERASGLLTDFNTNKITASQTQKQFLYNLISTLQNQQAKAAISAEKRTKAAAKQYLHATALSLV